MEWTVRYIDYPAQFRKLEAELMPAIRSVLATGDLILRRHLRDFEEHLAEFVGTKYAVGLNSGTDALYFAVKAAGLGPGDEVLTVSHTFVATVAGIRHSGATPVLVDTGQDHNMDADKARRAVTDRTKAIIPVHLNGRACEMDRLMSLAEAHDLVVIEDAAQAVGATYRGGKAGSFGLMGCFSFYPAKILGCYGDGGALVTNDAGLAEHLRMLRDNGRSGDGRIADWGYNSRLDNLQAAILDIKLKYLPDVIARRREIALRYHDSLTDIQGVQLPPPPSRSGPHFDVFQNYEIEAENRQGLVRHLKERGIETMIPWGGKAVHQFAALGLRDHFDLPRTERLFDSVLMLPMHTELTDGQVDYVAQCIREFYRAP